MIVKHVHGNIKIFFTKFCSNLISKIIFLFFKVLYPNVDGRNNDILISRATYAPWLDDIKYKNYYEKIGDLTLLDHPRLFNLYKISKQLKKSKGDIIDIGCMKGGVGLLLSLNDRNSKTYLFDTFDGFLDKDDFHKGEVFKYDGIKQITQFIKKNNLKKTFVYKKFFPTNLGKIKFKKIKLCHIDVNTYQSTKKCYEFVKNKIVKNGCIVFDDYGIYGLEKITNLVNKIYKKDNKKFTFINNYFGQCVLIKK